MIRAAHGTPFSDIPALILPALGQTLLMVGIVMVVVLLLGGPLGVLLFNLGEGGLFPNRTSHSVLSWTTSIGRSIPFLVLMAAIIPFTRFIVGTNIGIAAAVVPMSIAGTAFFARIVENAIRAVPSSLVKVARASGASNLQIITSVQIHEAVPILLGGLTINSIAMVDYSAIAGTIGAGGLGYVAVTYGYQRFDQPVMIATIVVLVVLVGAIQVFGDIAVKRTTPQLRRRSTTSATKRPISNENRIKENA
ncbi:ABC transporter permease [Microbacterium sp. CH12i]|uniref:methionine ABC transporter permease n=1 Tax=Microbacterium sp. CH12i TaxID=1479651 RepID=UPI0004615464|nr:methionine ABC transporter permease [Microbacterium sp. CH12i]KDA05521.1 ABC transporter permease [Microbacterium sp. CH12i]